MCHLYSFSCAMYYVEFDSQATGRKYWNKNIVIPMLLYKDNQMGDASDYKCRKKHVWHYKALLDGWLSALDSQLSSTSRLGVTATDLHILSVFSTSIRSGEGDWTISSRPYVTWQRHAVLSTMYTYMLNDLASLLSFISLVSEPNRP